MRRYACLLDDLAALDQAFTINMATGYARP